MSKTTLLLRRAPGESVIIETDDGQRIDVAVKNVKGKNCELLFIAAPDVRIDRNEVHRMKHRA